MESYPPTPLRAMTCREAAPVSMSAVTGSLARMAPEMSLNNALRSSRVLGLCWCVDRLQAVLAQELVHGVSRVEIVGGDQDAGGHGVGLVSLRRRCGCGTSGFVGGTRSQGRRGERRP